MKLVNVLPSLLATVLATTGLGAKAQVPPLAKKGCPKMMMGGAACAPIPTKRPANTPIAKPPTKKPSAVRIPVVPTRKPSRFPTKRPAKALPTKRPTLRPISVPTNNPSTSPSSTPSGAPFSAPSSAPSSSPSNTPSTAPTSPEPLPQFCMEGVAVTEHNGHLYGVYKSPTPLTWHQADDHFKLQECCGTKGHLVTITDAEEKAFVASISLTGTAWIGLNSEQDANTFVWTTGEPFSSALVSVVPFSSFVGAYNYLGTSYFSQFALSTFTLAVSLFEFDCKTP